MTERSANAAVTRFDHTETGLIVEVAVDTGTHRLLFVVEEGDEGVSVAAKRVVEDPAGVVADVPPVEPPVPVDIVADEPEPEYETLWEGTA